MQNKEKIREAAAKLGIILTEEQSEKFYIYYEMMIEWNENVNLTAITDFNEVVVKHFMDSLSLIKVFDPNSDCELLDLGTGAGFPGIPLKIAFPSLKITLLDSLNKRVKFLNEVIKKLAFEEIAAIHGRAEDFARDREFREQFDICVSRAVANMSTLSEYCLPYVKKGGIFVPYKSGNMEEELNQSKHAIKMLGGEIEKVESFMLPDTDIERTLVLIKKAGNTPKRYPRSAGKPAKEPLK